jgi:predicted  nucleic acid-binding Zn-ribbon protein
MPKRLTRDEFAKKAIDKHGEGRYAYNNVEYKGAHTKVDITCLICSKDFPQTPTDHLTGYGCPACGLEKTRKAANIKKKKAADEFTKKANATHKEGRYAYDNVKYKDAVTKVNITCLICSRDFSQTPDKHLQGRGCPVCAVRERAYIKKKKAADEFTKKAIKKHGEGRYAYGNVEYEDSATKVNITCLVCSRDFSQTPDNHLQGQGCPICYNKTEKKVHDYLINHYPDLIMQFKSKWCKNPETNCYYPFDFCIKEKRVIIELDGRHHFEDVKYWKSSFEDRHAADLVKQAAANDNGFRVIRLIQEDVWSDKYDWLTELLDNIEDDTKQNIFMCKNDEYDFFSESMEIITTFSSQHPPCNTSSPS